MFAVLLEGDWFADLVRLAESVDDGESLGVAVGGTLAGDLTDLCNVATDLDDVENLGIGGTELPDGLLDEFGTGVSSPDGRLVESILEHGVDFV